MPPPKRSGTHLNRVHLQSVATHAEKRLCKPAVALDQSYLYCSWKGSANERNINLFQTLVLIRCCPVEFCPFSVQFSCFRSIIRGIGLFVLFLCVDHLGELLLPHRIYNFSYTVNWIKILSRPILRFLSLNIIF